MSEFQRVPLAHSGLCSQPGGAEGITIAGPLTAWRAFTDHVRLNELWSSSGLWWRSADLVAIALHGSAELALKVTVGRSRETNPIQQLTTLWIVGAGDTVLVGEALESAVELHSKGPSALEQFTLYHRAIEALVRHLDAGLERYAAPSA
jgi:hypothetical protein